MRGVLLLFLRALSICQTITVVLGISLLIMSIQPDQSNPKWFVRRQWFFSKICLGNDSSVHGSSGQF